MLFAAAYSGDVNVALHALAQKVDVDAKHTKWAMTSLHEAAQRGHQTMVKLLLAHKASCFVRNKRNQTALDVALLAGESDCIDIIGDEMDRHRAQWTKHARRRSEGMAPLGLRGDAGGGGGGNDDGVAPAAFEEARVRRNDAGGARKGDAGEGADAGVDDAGGGGGCGAGDAQGAAKLPALTPSATGSRHSGGSASLPGPKPGTEKPLPGLVAEEGGGGGGGGGSGGARGHRRHHTGSPGSLGKEAFAAALRDNARLARFAGGESQLYRRRPVFVAPPRNAKTVDVQTLVKNARKEAERSGGIAMSMLSRFRAKPPSGGLARWAGFSSTGSSSGTSCSKATAAAGNARTKRGPSCTRRRSASVSGGGGGSGSRAKGRRRDGSGGAAGGTRSARAGGKGREHASGVGGKGTQRRRR